MPELPEVETVRRDLDAVLTGRTITEVILGRMRTIRRHDDPEQFTTGLRGAHIVATRRRGKYLMIDFQQGENAGVLVVHLRMSGQLLHALTPDDPLLAHTHVRLQLADGTEVRFVDPRTFGEMFLTSPACSELAHVGPDALDPLVTAKVFVDGARGRSVSLKGFLLDQGVVAGVGSIYADEICFRAGLRPSRSVSRISGPQFKRVHTMMIEVLEAAIEARGSTLGDGQYVDMVGRAGTFALEHRVHARAGLGCVDCGSIIRRGIVAQRSAYWCPTCQR